MGQAKFNIDVVNVSQPTFTETKKGPQGGYNTIEVAFKKVNKVTGKKELDGKKLVDFRFPEVYAYFKGLKGGEVVQVVSEKKENDKFWNWIGVAPVTGSPEVQAETDTGANKADQSGAVDNPRPAVRDSAATGSRGKVTGSNYETPAERALRREADRVRQYYIVRQSSISAAIDLLKAQPYLNGVGGTVFSKEQVVEVAKYFEQHVMGPVAPAAVATNPASDDVPF
jgi:hypothetical protein